MHDPRFSYLHNYLPVLYREQESAPLLDRYLANFEGLLTAVHLALSEAPATLRSGSRGFSTNPPSTASAIASTCACARSAMPVRWR